MRANRRKSRARRFGSEVLKLAMTGNPLAVLTAVVAPAILTNACTVLGFGTGTGWSTGGVKPARRWPRCRLARWSRGA